MIRRSNLRADCGNCQGRDQAAPVASPPRTLALGAFRLMSRSGAGPQLCSIPEEMTGDLLGTRPQLGALRRSVSVASSS